MSQMSMRVETTPMTIVDAISTSAASELHTIENAEAVCVRICAWKCVDMRISMFIDMCTDMCIDMRHGVAGYVPTVEAVMRHMGKHDATWGQMHSGVMSQASQPCGPTNLNSIT